MNKAKDFSLAAKRLFNYVKVETLAIIIACIFAIISVASMIILPQVLGDATDIVISGLMEKSVYKEVSKGYETTKLALEKVEEAKALVISINSLEGEQRNVYDYMLNHNYSIGHLKNEAKKPDTAIDPEDAKKILDLPQELNDVRLTKILGYVFDGEVRYKPLNEVDMTFGEYIELLEIEMDFTQYVPKEMLDYFMKLKINDPNGYEIINEYEKAQTVGEFLEATKLEGAFTIPKAYQETIYNVKLTSKPDIKWDLLSEKIIILSILAFLYSVFAYLQGFVLSGVAQRVSYNLRYEVNKKLFNMSMKDFDKKQKGDILSIISNDIDSISNSLNQTISQIITTIAMLIGVLVMMIRLNLLLSIIAIICVPLAIVIMKLIVNSSQKHFEKMQNTLALVNEDVEESFRGHDLIQSFNKQQEHIDVFDEKNKQLAKAALKSEFSANLMQPISKFIGNLSYVAACVFGGMIVISGSLTIGNLQSFVQYLRQFTQPINQMSSMFGLMQQSIAAAERVFEVIDMQEESEENKESFNEVASGEIIFDNISFKYDKEYVIDNFSLTVNAGQKVAIVGKTGAGKTTLMKLLMRFYELDKGRILLDKKDISKFKKADIRDNIGIVLQDAWLFEGSIKDNIAYGGTANDAEIKNAANSAKIAEFIESLEGGYDYLINSDASNVSHGQKQLITIARALLRNKPILILDEATSSVDTKTEKLLQTAMDKITKNRTSFIIAHRLSTIKNADIILVIDEGNIIEKGSHKELMELKGQYYNLYKSQFKC